MSASSNDKVDGVQKVAAFLLSLDKEISAKVMRSLDPVSYTHLTLPTKRIV